MADDADSEREARHARARVVSQVIREHEERPMGCSCGARMGDSIDRTWHLANQVAEAVGAHVRREVRERIAQEIKADRENVPSLVLTTKGQQAAWQIGMARAFTIARGDAR